MSKKFILIMHITSVSGHRQAALAIERALKSFNMDLSIHSINAFNYTNPISEKVVNNIYMGIIKKMPKVWEYLYDNPHIERCIGGIEDSVYYLNCEKLKSLFDKFNPKVIACTQAFPCGMVAAYKKRYNYNVPLVGILTDHAPHLYWIQPEVDYYVVASEDVRGQLRNKGVSENKIKVFGIPIDPKFKNINNRDTIAEKIGVDLNVPVILIMGGGQGLGPIQNILLTLDNMDLNFQIIVVGGTNQNLSRWLSDRKDSFKKKIFTFGYIDNIDEIMDISTFIITKAGGLTTSEALAKGLPIIVVDPIPGQETYNTDFLLKYEAAIKVKDEYDIDIVVRELLNSPYRLNMLRDNAKAISRPEAAADIAKLLLDLCLT